jgi:hypothetical protein
VQARLIRPVGLAIGLGVGVASPSITMVRADDCATSGVTTPWGDHVEATECVPLESDPGDSEPGAQPIAAPGGGSGGQTRCTSTPRGDLGEVRRVWAAVNRGRNPDPDDPAFTDDQVQGPNDSERVVVRSWFRIQGDSIQVLYVVECPGQPDVEQWVSVIPTDEGGLAPQVTPEQLIPSLWSRVQRQLPTPIPRIAPADLAADGFAFVQTPAFFWVDQAPGQWGDVSATAAVAGLSLTVTAAPEQLVVTTGDGKTLQCAGAPAPFPAGADPVTFVGCRHVYRHSSAMAENGQTYPVTVAIVWHATWQASNGQSGDLGTLTTTSATRDLAVAEIQAVVTQG